MRKIGIITSGGDCGGLNAVIKGAALTANAKGVKAFVVPNGYAGLYNLVNMEGLTELTPVRLDSVFASAAGSEAGHSRVKIGKIDDPGKYDRIKEGLAKHGLDGLVISGGDDTGSVIVDLSKQGIPCVHAPKTMDLDLQTYSVGGDSTINRIAQFVRDLRTTAITHNRIFVVDVFGRYAGHSAFRGGVAAEADCILIPEIPADFDVVQAHAKERFMQRIRQSDVNAGTYMVVVAEGLRDASGSEILDKAAGKDAFGHYKLAGAGKYVAAELEERMKADPEIVEFMKEQGMYVEGVYQAPEVRAVVPSHLVRCGQSSAYDVSFGLQVGAAAVLLLLDGKTGVTAVDVEGKRVNYMPTEKAIGQRYVDLEHVALYEQMGICFGRAPQTYAPDFHAQEGTPSRHL
ncbi:MAG: 6-phosphofructokinase [Planctomycetota bacterium]